MRGRRQSTFTHVPSGPWEIGIWQGRLPVTPGYIHTLGCTRLKPYFDRVPFYLPATKHRIYLGYIGDRSKNPVHLFDLEFSFEPVPNNAHWADWAAFQSTKFLAWRLQATENAWEVLQGDRKDHAQWWGQMIRSKYKMLLEDFPPKP